MGSTINLSLKDKDNAEMLEGSDTVDDDNSNPDSDDENEYFVDEKAYKNAVLELVGTFPVDIKIDGMRILFNQSRMLVQARSGRLFSGGHNLL
jgi:hypothetical protein